MKYSGVKWIGDIPDIWEIKKVKHCFYISKEQAHEENPTILSLARSGIKFRDISNNEGQLAASYDNYNPVKPGDLLLNPMDLYSGANCNMSEVSGVISPAYVNLRAKVDLNPKFFDYFFKTQYWTMAMFAHGKGVSFDNRWTLNADTLLNYHLPTPSFEKQNQVVDFIMQKTAEIESLIEIENKQIDLLIEFKQSLISKVITQGLSSETEMKDSGFVFIGSIPKHWKILKVKSITVNHLQGYYDKAGYSNSGYRLLRITDLREDGCLSILNAPFVSPSDGIENFIIKPGDFCFARTGGAGLFGFVEEPIEPSVFASYLIRFRFKNQCNLFLKFVFLSNCFQREIDSMIHGAVNRNVHAENILETHVPIPPLEEQIKIANYLKNKCSEINALIKLKKLKIEKLIEYKKSLVFEYTTGKREVIA